MNPWEAVIEILDEVREQDDWTDWHCGTTSNPLYRPSAGRGVLFIRRTEEDLDAWYAFESLVNRGFKGDPRKELLDGKYVYAYSTKHSHKT